MTYGRGLQRLGDNRSMAMVIHECKFPHAAFSFSMSVSLIDDLHIHSKRRFGSRLSCAHTGSVLSNEIRRSVVKVLICVDAHAVNLRLRRAINRDGYKRAPRARGSARFSRILYRVCPKVASVDYFDYSPFDFDLLYFHPLRKRLSLLG